MVVEDERHQGKQKDRVLPTRLLGSFKAVFRRILSPFLLFLDKAGDSVQKVREPQPAVLRSLPLKADSVTSGGGCSCSWTAHTKIWRRLSVKSGGETHSALGPGTT